MPARVNDKKMSKTFILSDESLNARGFRLLTSGANLEQFKKNPVMFFNHYTWGSPIGRWEKIRVDGAKILADPVFDTADSEAAKIAGKVERNFLRMTSVGIVPLEWSDAPEHLLPGQTCATITKWVLKEASIVGIGANNNALRMYDTSGRLLDEDEMVQLMLDTKVKLKNNKMNENLIKMLNLAEGAGESDVESAIKQKLLDLERLTLENKTFKERIDELNELEKKERTAEAVRLTDEAVKDGRLNSDAKAEMLEMFALDYEKAKKVLLSIPKRPSIKEQIEKQKKRNDEEYQSLAKLSWDDLDKAGKLSELREKYADLYDEKFEKRFGSKPGI